MEYLYQKIVDEIQSKGIKVIHRKLSGDYGRCYWTNKTIVMDSSVRGTLIGCIMIYHEFNHFLDYKYKRNRLYYKEGPSKPNLSRRKKIDIMWKAEWECMEYALTRLKKYGITKRHHPYFQKTWMKKNILPVWIKAYKM